MPSIFEERTKKPHGSVFKQRANTEQGIATPEEEGFQLTPGQRQLGQHTARAAETILGAPRALGEFLESLVPEQALTKGAEFVGLEKPVTKALEIGKKFAPYKLFPKKEDVREFGKTLFGQTFEPQTITEKKAGELTEDFTSLAFPFFSGPVKIIKPLLVSVGAHLGKEIAGMAGAGKNTQNFIKQGLMVVGSLYNPKGLDKFKDDLYQEARNLRPSDATVTAKNLRSKLENFKKELQLGGSARSKEMALKKADEILGKIENDNIQVRELEEFKKTINEAKTELYKDINLTKTGIKSAKRNLNNVSSIVDKGLEEYGKTNPEWEAFYRPANEAHGAIAESKKVSNLINKNYKKFATPGLAALFGATKLVGGLPTAGVGVAGVAALKTGELIARIMKSPTLSKYYSQVILDALKGNAEGLKDNMKKLDYGLLKEQVKNNQTRHLS